MRRFPSVLGLLAFAACSFDPPPETPLPGSATVRGALVDFDTRLPLVGPVTISTSGLLVPPAITTQGGTFTVGGVPDYSAFQILVSALAYRPTFTEAVIVETEDFLDVTAEVVSEAYLAGLASGFGISLPAGRGVLLARVVDDDGRPVAGVAKADLVLSALITGAIGPFFLDGSRRPAPTATATSSSGLAVWFDVPPGLVWLSPGADFGVTLDMPMSPISGGAVTLARIHAFGSAPELPNNVSFRNNVLPIFSALDQGGRGCVVCHSAGGIGRDLGGLTLDASPSIVYAELTREDPLRVQLQAPEESLLLTYPSREDPPDRHPNVTFTSPFDPDYLKILVWIQEGARDN